MCPRLGLPEPRLPMMECCVVVFLFVSGGLYERGVISGSLCVWVSLIIVVRTSVATSFLFCLCRVVSTICYEIKEYEICYKENINPG